MQARWVEEKGKSAGWKGGIDHRPYSVALSICWPSPTSGTLN